MTPMLYHLSSIFLTNDNFFEINQKLARIALEQISMAPKMFEPLKFNFILISCQRVKIVPVNGNKTVIII